MDQHRNTKIMKVIIIDQNAENGGRLASIFANPTNFGFPETGLSYEINVLGNCVQGMANYQTLHPDLLMISVRGDISSAQQLCDQIRKMEDARHTGIIFIANDEDEGDELAVRCLELGADDVIRANSTLREVYARANAVLKLKAMTDELRTANHRLSQLSYTDELTGLANMRAFNARYSKAVGDCFNGRACLGVIMMDLDNFKYINDSTNHLMGSHVISEVGRIIRELNITTDNDCAARFGGDEYVIFTIDDSLDKVQQKAEMILDEIRKAKFVKDGQTRRITTSIGVAFVPPGYKGKAEDPIKAADMMLYKSKHEGRDRLNAMMLRDPRDIEPVDASDDGKVSSINEKKIKPLKKVSG